jgi:hypothetical protein
MGNRTLLMSVAVTLFVSTVYARSLDTAPPADPATLPAAMESDPTLPDFTIYHPRNLSDASKLPILVWAEGGCANVGNAYAVFLSEIASNGYFIVAVGPIVPDYRAPLMPRPTTSTPPAKLQPAGAAPTLPPGATPKKLIQAIDWAVTENEQQGSPYYHKLDTNEIAAMGHSCGGVQAGWAVLNDSRIKTVIFGNSGLFPEPRFGMDVSSSDLARLKVPVAYFIGGPTDVAYPPAEENLPHYSNVPVFIGNVNVGHGGTYHDPNGGEYARATIAWLNWQLKGDAKGARLFKGPKCGLCEDPQWSVQQKMLAD